MLSEKYRPTRICDFIGLEKPRKIVTKLAANPQSCALLFVGPSGTGKTTMALALAESVSAEVIHIPSQHCTVAELEEACGRTAYYPMQGKRFWMILIDEFDQSTEKAQLALLSKLDATAFPKDTIFIFTCNQIENLEARFLSRCMVVEFSSYGMAADISAFLKDVWRKEAGDASSPDLVRLAKDARNNIRDCLNRLEVELMSA